MRLQTYNNLHILFIVSMHILYSVGAIDMQSGTILHPYVTFVPTYITLEP